MPEGKLTTMLRRLREGQVEYIVVGGLAAVLNGAPIQTFDVDIVYSREPANVNRLMEVLDSLEAVFRIQPERRLRPNPSHLAAGGHLNLLTSLGPLDLLGSVGQDLGYGELLLRSSEMDIASGVRVRVLDLETIISIKAELASEKDLAVLPVLRRTLSENRRKKQ
jgi:predicted nucleotidyltransferase